MVCTRVCPYCRASPVRGDKTLTPAASPDLPSLCVVASNPAPDGARVGYFETEHRVRIRYALFPRATGTGAVPKGTICLVQGRSECIEKYFETISDFQKRGFAVATFDLRGQGGSQRFLGTSRHGYVEHFDDYWTDLKSFHAEILLPDCPPPFYLVAHSTGGLVGLLAASRDRLMFDRVFLCSPMIGLPGLPFSLKTTSRILNAARFLGLSRMALQRREDKPQSEARFANNPLTSDKTRYMRAVNIIAAAPELAVTAPTIAWTASALNAMREAQADSFPQRLKIPVFMAAAAADTVVSTPATEALGLRMRTGHHTVIAGARHEMFMENDAIRGQLFAAIDAFITEPSP